jgi:hypothetical protein
MHRPVDPWLRVFCGELDFCILDRSDVSFPSLVIESCVVWWGDLQSDSDPSVDSVTSIFNSAYTHCPFARGSSL